MSGVVALCMLITHFVLPTTEDTESHRIMAFSIWTFFVVINAYYGGALTMFFTGTVTVDFETRRDVIQAYPDWNLIFKDGSEINFVVPASHGDPDFAEFWARDQADQAETRFTTVEEGLVRIATNQEIMHVDEGQLKGWLRGNPFHVQVFVQSTLRSNSLIIFYVLYRNLMSLGMTFPNIKLLFLA